VSPQRGRRWSDLLWVTFATIIIVCGVTLLRACGMFLPFHSAFPVFIWNYCPATSSMLSAEVERDDALRREADRLEIDLAQHRLACAGLVQPGAPLDLPTHDDAPRPQQTAEFRSPPDLPVDRWDKKDLSLLKGCWKLGRDAPIVLKRNGRPTAVCTMKAGRLCFGDNGKGTAEQSSICPQGSSYQCKAPLSAKFNSDGTLGTVQPQVPCQGTDNVTVWEAHTDTCRRVDDKMAICGDKEFRREQP
jgi:hypothetical protein